MAGGSKWLKKAKAAKPQSEGWVGPAMWWAHWVPGRWVSYSSRSQVGPTNKQAAAPWTQWWGFLLSWFSCLQEQMLPSLPLRSAREEDYGELDAAGVGATHRGESQLREGFMLPGEGLSRGVVWTFPGFIASLGYGSSPCAWSQICIPPRNPPASPCGTLPRPVAMAEEEPVLWGDPESDRWSCSSPVLPTQLRSPECLPRGCLCQQRGQGVVRECATPSLAPSWDGAEDRPYPHSWAGQEVISGLKSGLSHECNPLREGCRSGVKVPHQDLKPKWTIA